MLKASRCIGVSQQLMLGYGCNACIRQLKIERPLEHRGARTGGQGGCINHALAMGSRRRSLRGWDEPASLRTGVKDVLTLLVKSKTRGKLVLHPTFEGQGDRIHSFGDTHSRGIEMNCRDFTNRVCPDALWTPWGSCRASGGKKMVRAKRSMTPVVYQMKVTLKGSKPPIWRRL
jgi:hypothetical protein